MAFAGMKTMGPECCCGGCMNIYTNSGPGIIKGQADGSGWYTDSAALFGSRTFAQGYFDFVNQNYYTHSAIATVERKLWRVDSEMASADNFYTAPADRVVGAVAVDPQREYVYYAARNTPDTQDVYIYRLDYDGSGEVELYTYNVGVSGIVTHWITPTRDGQYLFYTRSYTGARKVFRLNADGTGDTEIFDGTATGLITTLCVDNDNEYLFWSNVSYIYRSAWDGSGATIIYDGATSPGPKPSHVSFRPRLGNWSHKNNRLYFYCGSSAAPTATGLGLYSMLSDGTDLRAEIVRPDFYDSVGGTPVDTRVTEEQSIQIGCGYETTGSGTMAS